MARRRMIDPDFWTDSRVKRLSPVERLFFLGMVSHADDEGRLATDPAFLRSIIFPYDDFTLDAIKSMRDHIVDTNPNVQLYENGGEEYLYFRKWRRYQKPSHPQPSKIPKPPELQEPIPESIKEQDQCRNGTEPEQFRPRSGQVSQVKDRLGQDSLARLSTEKSKAEERTLFRLPDELTDFDCESLENARLERLVSAAEAILTWWEHNIGLPEKPSHFLELVLKGLRAHRAVFIVPALAKAKKYGGGKHKSWNYVEKAILELKGRARDSPA